jgi:sulfite reductase alpha subunit-like flavoprotein
LFCRLDLIGVPKKASVAKLAECCSEPAEAAQLQHVCSKSETGKKLWKQFIEAQCVGIGEILALFPSCTPTLDVLASVCNPLPPRAYSIASSPLINPKELSVSFSVVKYECSIEAPTAVPKIRRRGLCTTYLESMLSPWLEPRGAAGDGASLTVQIQAPALSLPIIHKPTIHFRLPSAINTPLILIGPGTGVAPFVGFLQHRAALQFVRQPGRSSSSGSLNGNTASPACMSSGAKECCTGEWRGGFEVDDLPVEETTVTKFVQSVPPGPIWLFFGCRNEEDFLYENDLESMVDNGILTVFDVAFSRKFEQKVYVTHRMRARAAELAELIIQQQASVYVCGDGTSMAKDVDSALLDILAGHGAPGVTSVAEAKAMLADMRQRRRYVMDIWS